MHIKTSIFYLELKKYFFDPLVSVVTILEIIIFVGFNEQAAEFAEYMAHDI